MLTLKVKRISNVQKNAKTNMGSTMENLTQKIKDELNNYEAFWSEDPSDCIAAMDGIATREQVLAVFGGFQAHDGHQEFISHIEQGGLLSDIPFELRCSLVCDAAMDIYPKNIWNVPEKELTLSIIERGVEADGRSLIRANRLDHVITRELCITAVTNNGWALDGVPAELKDASICNIAFESNMAAYVFIPDDLKTQSMARKAVEHDPKNLMFTPDHLKTQSLCDSKGVMDTIHLIRFIPDQFLTRAHHKKAMQLSDLNGWRDAVFRTPFFSELTVEANPCYVEHVPPAHVTDKMVSNAFWKHPTTSVLIAIPDQFKTAEMCLKSIENHGSVQGIPESLLTQEMVNRSSELGGLWLPGIPEKFKTRDVSLAYAIKNPRDLYSVPDCHIDDDFLNQVKLANPSENTKTQVSARLIDKAFNDYLDASTDLDMRTTANSELIWMYTHQDFRGLDSDGDKSVLFLSSDGATRSNKIHNLDDDVFQSKLYDAIRAHCRRIRDNELRCIFRGFGIENVISDTSQWRDSLADVKTMIESELPPGPAKKAINEVEEAQIIYPSDLPDMRQALNHSAEYAYSPGM